MKTVQFSAFGRAADVVELVEAADPPAPAPGHVTIAIEAFPINPADLLLFEGRYAHKPALPAFPGAESVARVIAVGDGVAGLAIGDRVMPLGRANWTERKAVPAEELIPLPQGGDPVVLSMLKVNPATALLLLRAGRGELKSGDWVIQNAANSAVGRLVIQLAKQTGLHTVNVVRRPGLEDALTELGADVVLVDGPDLADRVAEASGNAAIPLGLDAVAGAATERLSRCLAQGGVIANYGLLSGDACQVDPHALVFRQVMLHGFWLAPMLTSLPRQELIETYDYLARLLIDGRLTIPIHATYPLDRIADALAAADEGERDGKIVVTTDALNA